MQNAYITKTKNTAHEVYKGLAKLRNHLIHKTTSDYVFSVDTDIMFGSNILHKLLSHNKDMVSALICNGYMLKEICNPYIYPNVLNRLNDAYIHLKDYEGKGLIECDLTGAISLMSSKLVKSGAEYGFSTFGEDAEFCNSAQKLGFKLYCDTSTKATHIMNKEYLDLYLKGEFIW
jgi:GT2 family glycosyltransferase